MGTGLSVLIISYQPEKDVISMGHVVDSHSSRALAESFENEEQAVGYVARLDGTREEGAAEFSHFFIYQDGRFDPKWTDKCIPFSKVCLDQYEEGGGVPEHLLEVYEAELAFQKQRSEEVRVEFEKRMVERDKEESHQRDILLFEHLKEKLGK